MTFEIDLGILLDRLDYDMRADEAARAEFGEDYTETYHVAGEAATLIPETLVRTGHEHVYCTTPDRGVWHCADCGVPLERPF